MASSTKFLCFFLLTTLVCSLQIHARDSQFFSKVTRERDDTTNPSNNFHMSNENEAETFSKAQKLDEEPVFTPQTTGNGYGLYGHETGLDAPSTTSTPTSLYNKDDNKFEYDTKYFDNNNNNNNEFAQTKYFNNHYNEKKNPFNNNNNNEFAQTKYFNNNNEKQDSFTNNNGFDQTKYFNNNGKQYSKTNNKNEQYDQNKYLNNEYDQNKYFNDNEQYDLNKYLNNNNEKQNAFTNNNLYNREKNYVPELKGLSEFSYTNKAGPSKYVSNYNGGVEKQGMSDTRYLENGKYNYDINSEKKFDNPNNNYNKFGQYYGKRESNNHDEYYKNNYYNGNGMQQEFQNQFPEEGEFDFDDQP